MSFPRSRIGRSCASPSRMAASVSHQLCCDALPGRAVDQHRQAATALDLVEHRSGLAVDERDTRVDVVGSSMETSLERAYTAHSSLGRGSARSGTAG